MNEPFYRVALPFKVGEWVKDSITGYQGAVCGYSVHSDLSVSVTVTRLSEDGSVREIDFLANRISASPRSV